VRLCVDSQWVPLRSSRSSPGLADHRCAAPGCRPQTLPSEGFGRAVGTDFSSARRSLSGKRLNWSNTGPWPEFIRDSLFRFHRIRCTPWATRLIGCHLVPRRCDSLPAAGFQAAARRSIKAGESGLLAPSGSQKAALRAELQQKHPRQAPADPVVRRSRTEALQGLPVIHLCVCRKRAPAPFLRPTLVFPGRSNWATADRSRASETGWWGRRSSKGL